MTDPSSTLSILERTGLALAIGFLVGIERGWKQRTEPEGGRVAGLRTFALSGLLGGIAGDIFVSAGAVPLATTSIVFGAAFTLFQYRHSIEDRDSSVTSTVAGLLVFALGAYAAIGDPRVAAAAGVATAIVLAFKQALHGWLQAITWKEFRSALIILAATFIALPVLPDGPIDPWGLFNLRSLWILTTLVAGASFGGYVFLRALGPEAGLVAGSLTGAIASSTAVTLDLARRVRSDEVGASGAAAAASLATVVSLVRVAILSAVFSMQAVLKIWPALAAGAFVCLIGALLLHRFNPAHRRNSPYAQVKSPLDLLSVARFAVLLCGLTILANIASRLLGSAGLNAFAATAGLVDADAATLAVGRLIGNNSISPSAAAIAILLAAASNQAFKMIIGFVAGGAAFALRFTAVVTVATALGAMVAAWTVWLP
ncbi:MAG: DUF4010 domain-containing protein [Alphaproteobacteria bacterium]|nr:DUF4010 domain-containing protein [Alphaproteobacteria bacterium]